MSSLITTGAGLKVTPEAPARRQNVKIERILDTELHKFLKENLEGGGIAGVICNTVANAMDAYNQLSLVFAEQDLYLSHSRFVAPDRMYNDAQVLHLAGKNSERNTLKIIVGTQVLEQSLDVDFDIIVSEPAPLESSIQRMGRLHRHDRDHRPGKLSAPRYVIMEPAEETRNYVYDDWPMELSRDCFERHNVISIPDDILSVVTHVHSTPTEVAGLAKSHTDEVNARRDRTRPWLIKEPSRKGTSIYGLVDGLEKDDNGEARVRGSESGPEVIAIFRDPDGSLWVPYYSDGVRCAHYLSGDGSLSYKDVVYLLASTLRLPLRYSKQKYIDALESGMDIRLYEMFQQDKRLKYEIAVIFTESKHTVEDRVLSYDKSLGLEDYAE